MTPLELGGFASANFLDAEETRPLGAVFDIGGNGNSAPYSTAVQAMLTKHMDEIRGKTAAALPHPISWKARMRDFINKKNTDLLDFLNLSVPSHPVLGTGELLLRRFGNPLVTPSHVSVRDFVMDASGSVNDIVKDLDTALLTLRTDSPLKDYGEQTRILYEEYREAGDAVLKAQAGLKAKLDRLDRIQGKIVGLFEVEPNEKYDPLLEASEGYLKRVYELSNIEEDYNSLVEAYRRFAVLRDFVVMSRGVVGQEAEPVCTICLHEAVQYALVPCGHTYCQGCMRRQGNMCSMCRGGVKDRVKLFFG